MGPNKDQRQELSRRIDKIEEAYEFMLAYAAQGRPGEDGAETGSNIRVFLQEADAALEGLAGVLRQYFLDQVEKNGLQEFLGVFQQDAQKARAAIRMVLSLPAISSQVTDNLNSSTHLRTLLTDIFLIDEILKAREP